MRSIEAAARPGCGAIPKRAVSRWRLAEDVSQSRNKVIDPNKKIIDGGVGGIRTLDTAFRPYNGLANRRLQPLGHHSKAETFNEISRVFRLLCSAALDLFQISTLCPTIVPSVNLFDAPIDDSRIRESMLPG